LTAVFVHLTGPGMRLRCRGFGARLLAVLAVALPIPVFAVLGLSLPLPATVERIAAQLVPFGDAGSPAVRTDGTIVLVPGEQRPQGERADRAGSAGAITRGTGLPVAAITGPRAAGPGTETSAGATAPAGGDVRGASPTDDGRLTSAPSSSTPTTPTTSTTPTSETTTPPGGGSEPAEPPTLIDTATSAANGAVNTATTAVTDTVAPTVDTAEDTATGVLGPIKP
jgi:hypothetical protein